MPVSTRRSPLIKNISLRTPQARCLAALVPNNPADPVLEWPFVTRAQLGVRAGYTAISGTVTRALNGIHPDSSSGDPHLGLLALKLVDEIILNIEGVTEINYRATAAGIQAYQKYLAERGGVPELRDAAACINDRYKK